MPPPSLPAWARAVCTARVASCSPRASALQGASVTTYNTSRAGRATWVLFASNLGKASNFTEVSLTNSFPAGNSLLIGGEFLANVLPTSEAPRTFVPSEICVLASLILEDGVDNTNPDLLMSRALVSG